MTDFTELQYRTPDSDSASYIKTAVDVISSMQDEVPNAVRYLLEPSNILVLAGLRSVSPYNSFEELTRDESARLSASLRKQGFSVLKEATVYEPPSSIYSVVNILVLQKLSGRYSFLNDDFPIFKGNNHDDFALWAFVCERYLANRMYDQNDSLPRKWASDYYSPANLRFGMELGYPGIAISSLLHTETNGDVHPESAIEEVMIANQEGSAWVTFDVDKTVRQSSEITSTESLWKSVITGVKKECGAI